MLAPLLHPLFTSMTGLGVAYAAARRHAGAGPVIAGWLAAMLLHGIVERPVRLGRAGAAHRVRDHVLRWLAVVIACWSSTGAASCG